MDAIGVKITRLTQSKATQLREYQKQFQEAVLWAVAEAARAGIKSPAQMQQALARPLWGRGLPPRYADAALMQAYRLLRSQPPESEEQAEPAPRPSEEFLAAFARELAAAGVPEKAARAQAEAAYRQVLQQAPRQTQARVPLTVHALDYELQASPGLNNWEIRLRTPRRDWLLLHLEVRPWQVEKLSRVCSYLELVPNDRGEWYAGMRIYRSVRPKEGVVPLVIREVPA